MIVVSLPVADRRIAHAFYRDALGLEAIGAPASDGVPEPLQFALAEGVRLGDRRPRRRAAGAVRVPAEPVRGR